MAGTPIKSRYPKGRCGAMNRQGKPCGIRLEVYPCNNGKMRCKYHGGKSTGPRTPQGKAKSALNLINWRKNVKRDAQSP